MVQDSAAKAGYAADAQKAVANAPAGASRGIDLITGPQGELVGFAVTQVAQLYTTVDRIVMSQRILALPVADLRSCACWQGRGLSGRARTPRGEARFFSGDIHD